MIQTRSLPPAYEILFEPVQIGPVIAPNRFFQVAHCNGMGYRHPHRLAAMRGVKAQGGWGVVCTEEVEIHPSADLAPSIEGRLWDDQDIRYHELTTAAIHEHGSLAAIELVHGGHHATNLDSRLPPIAPTGRPADSYHPVHARTMDRQDIRDVRKWHVDAAKRAKSAGYDVIYAYAGHNMSLLMHFLQARNNRRTDEYGGSVRNRVRLIEEVLLDMKEAVGDTCAIALRLAVDEICGINGIASDGEAEEIVSILADLPDLWDVNVSDWSNDSVTARFEPNEGYQDQYTGFVKKLTSKPVVGVGRYTSPDAMAARVKNGVLDFIGAARPSIADPFLPNKIRENRINEIRECIGCNICVSGDMVGTPIRCTQNPTMGEEWRRGWNPESIAPKTDDGSVLIVGSGPSGLEAALQFSNRGYNVTLAEAKHVLGGRLNAESKLPGFNSYIRVRDYREYLLKQRSNVEIYFDSKLRSADIVEFGFAHVLIATGAHWRRDGSGRHHETGMTRLDMAVLTPDDVFAGCSVTGNVVIYDDDHYYMGGALAEMLAQRGLEVTVVTPALAVSQWTENTLELNRIQKRLIESGVTRITSSALSSARNGEAWIECTYSGRARPIPCDTLICVTARDPNTELFDGVSGLLKDRAVPHLKTLKSIGDCLVPGTIANATYLGHLSARNHGKPNSDDDVLRRDMRIS